MPDPIQDSVLKEDVHASGAPSAGEGDKGTEMKGGGSPPQIQDPPIRRSAARFIIERQAKKIEKLQSRPSSEEGEESSDEEGVELTPEASALIEEKIQSSTKPLLDVLAKDEDEREITDHLSAHPEDKPLEPVIRKYMEHPNYKGVAVSFIAAAVRQRTGAYSSDAKAKAESEVNQSSLGGGSSRGSDSGEGQDPWAMPDKDFEKLIHEVKTGQRQHL